MQREDMDDTLRRFVSPAQWCMVAAGMAMLWSAGARINMPLEERSVVDWRLFLFDVTLEEVVDEAQYTAFQAEARDEDAIKRSLIDVPGVNLELPVHVTFLSQAEERDYEQLYDFVLPVVT